MVTTSEPARPWADGPWPLIETPSKTRNVVSFFPFLPGYKSRANEHLQSEHPAVYIANEMAFAHNSMLRGLNSIYLQASFVQKPRDVSDFLFFIYAWAGWVSHHHVLEEEKMFPGFERVIGVPNFLETNVEQHHSFQPLLKKLLEYSSKTQPADYQASVVRQLIEEMAPSFRQHLSDEISSLLSMEPYDGDALLEIYKECEADAGKQDKVLFILVLLAPYSFHRVSDTLDCSMWCLRWCWGFATSLLKEAISGLPCHRCRHGLFTTSFPASILDHGVFCRAIPGGTHAHWHLWRRTLDKSVATEHEALVFR